MELKKPVLASNHTRHTERFRGVGCGNGLNQIHTTYCNRLESLWTAKTLILKAAITELQEWLSQFTSRMLL